MMRRMDASPTVRRKHTPMPKPGPSRGARACFDIYYGADQFAREKLIARVAREYPTAKDPRSNALLSLKAWSRGEKTPQKYNLVVACQEGGGIEPGWWLEAGES